METKKKFILEFDEPPALVFVQRNEKAVCELYQDGEKVNGIRSLRIYTAFDEPTTHEVEYLTGMTKQ